MKKRFSGPQIVAKLRQADVLIGKGKMCFPKAPFVYSYQRANLESFPDGHVRAFEYFGGADSDRDTSPTVRQGGLRDRELVVSQPQRETVTPATDAVTFFLFMASNQRLACLLSTILDLQSMIRPHSGLQAC